MLQEIALFAGVGGITMGLELAELAEPKLFCEIEKYPVSILDKRYWDIPVHDDVTTLNKERVLEYLPDYDPNKTILTGGFPCQDLSYAGKRAGLEEGKRSSLWYEMWRLLSDIRPRYLLAENVPGLFTAGLDRVVCGLAEIGYDCEWTTLSAGEVGCWHKRERVFIFAERR